MSPADFKAAREALHLTKGYLAKRWGVARQSIQRWESGYRDVPEQIAKDMKKMLDERQDIIDGYILSIDDWPPEQGVLIVPKDSDSVDDFEPAYWRSVMFEVAAGTGNSLIYDSEKL